MNSTPTQKGEGRYMDWKTKSGEKLKISEMTIIQLLNALSYAKRRNKEGVIRMGGSPADIDSMWVEIDHHFYDDAIVELKREIKRRDL